METAALFNLPSDTTLWDWQRIMETQGEDAPKSMKKGRPSMKKQESKHQLKDRWNFDLRHKYPVKALLKIAGIPRSTYYYLVKHWNLHNRDVHLKK